MSNGGYLGGHTVIGWNSGWFSGDDFNSDRVRKKKTSRKATKATSSAPSTSSSPKKSGPSLEKLREAYLGMILDALFKQVPHMPPPPKKAKTLLDVEVTKAGGPKNWAKQQPGYAKLLAKKKKKHGGLPPVTPKIASKTGEIGPEFQSDIVRRLVSKLEMVKKDREDAKRILANCDAQITKIKSALAELGAPHN